MKTTKGGKVMNPTDAYRKEIRKRELKRNKKERKKVREVGILKKDPDTLKDQIEKLEVMKADGALDKARKHKKRQLEDTLNLVIKKRKEYESKQREKGETPVIFSHLGPPTRRHSSAEEEERDKHPQPEDSVYYHPTLNPTGAPPPGKPPMFKSSIGPRIPLSAVSSSGTASTSMTESNDGSLVLPPPPPPPPLPNRDDFDAGDASVISASLPLPPPPPMPPKPVVLDLGMPLPPPPFPPVPPGPPPREQVAKRPPLPPPPPIQQQQSTQPRPPGNGGNERESRSAISDNPTSKDLTRVHSRLPPPPPPPGLPLKSTSNQSEGASSESDGNGSSGAPDLSKMILPPPPPRQQPPMAGPPLMTTLQHPDILPPGISHYPPPPPPQDMRLPLSAPDAPIQAAPQGIMVPLITRPPFGLPPGPPPPMMKPPLPPGPPPLFQEDDYAAMRPQSHQKPSYVKSAASTVVKRPLAQHTPELTSMVPASVRVRRETAVSKPKPKAPQSSMPLSVVHQAPPIFVKPAPSNAPPAAPTSIDDSYMAFLEDMKSLGALDG